jgi:hypothetical protein
VDIVGKMISSSRVQSWTARHHASLYL